LGYIKNRIPIAALPYSEGAAKDAATPMEAYLDRLPNLKKIIVFGCSAWPILAKNKFPRKDGPMIKTDPYVFVGMKGSSIYRLYNMLSYQEETYADIGCNEYLYPWRKHQQDMQKALGSPLLGHTPMPLRSAQTDNRTEIGVDLTGIRDEIGAESTSNRIEIDADSTSYIERNEIGPAPSTERNEIGPVPDRTRGANPHV
jgi:hypothetical protein